MMPPLERNDAAPRFRDDLAPHNGMIPPGVIRGLAGAAVGLIRSPLWPPQRRIDASGANWNARCARDYSAEVFRRIDARDRPAARHGPIDGAGDLEAGGRRGLSWPLPEDMNDEALEAALYA